MNEFQLYFIYEHIKQTLIEYFHEVLPVNGQVQTHELGQLRIVESKHFGVVGRPIQIVIDGADTLAALVCVAVDGGCDDWQLSDQVNAVFVGGFPVL